MSDVLFYNNIPGRLEGTLVAAFLTQNEILLCSDGRIVNAITGSVVADNWPKVHQLTPKIGLLTLGRHLPGLVNRFHGKWLCRVAASVLDAATILRSALEEEWLMLDSFPGHIDDLARVFVFIAGYDITNQPRLYYLDNQTNPSFLIQERSLFTADGDVEIAALSHGSGSEHNPSNNIVRHFEAIRRQQPGLNTRYQLLSSFNAVKNELRLTNTYIGGHTFAAAISPAVAFHFITS